MPIRAFLAVLGDFGPLKLWYHCSDPKGIQLGEKHTFLYITRQNWSSGLAHSWAKEEANKVLSCRRETALQGALVFAKSGRLELGDNILRTL